MRSPLPIDPGDFGLFIDGDTTKAPPGFYSVVRQEEGRLFAAVDRIRSLPIFYSQGIDGSLTVSDSADWLMEQSPSPTLDIEARNDFLVAGYCTGNSTMISGVRQLQAGQYLEAEATVRGVQVTVGDHFIFRRSYQRQESSEGELLDQLADVTDTSITRLLEGAGGRQIVIPLSGGNDSRIIAILLARRCPDQVLTLAYGQPRLGEVAVSRRVAEALGLKWSFIEFNRGFWQDLRSSKEAARLLSSMHQFSSAPYMQDWPAIWEAQRRGLVNEDAVVVPGHSGDVPTGGMMLLDLLASQSKADVARALRERHYTLWPLRFVGQQAGDLEQRIGHSSLPASFGQGENGLEAVSMADSWNWRERQGKWLVNSLRGVEFRGLSWWMPLWDHEFNSFWMTVPLRHLRGRSLYRKFVDSELEDSIGYTIPNYHHEGLTPQAVNARFKAWLKQRLPLNLSRQMAASKRQFIGTPTNFGQMGWEAWVPDNQRDRFRRTATSVTSFASLYALSEVESVLPDAVPEQLKTV